MITNFIQLDFNKENDLKVPSVQYDSGSRFVKIKLQRNKSPFKIDGYRVTVVANKVDGTEIMNDCTILDGVNGVVQFEITEQFNAVEGVVDCQLKLFKGKTLLTSMPFSINVVKSVSTKEIVSSNELKTLVNALGEVQDIDNRFAQTNAQLSQIPNQGFEYSTINTMTERYDSQYVNVKDFGAFGDGITDDTEAVKRAIAYMCTKAKFVDGNSGWKSYLPTLYFPHGKYVISTKGALNCVGGALVGYNIKGAGYLNSEILYTYDSANDSDGGYLLVNGDENWFGFSYIEDLSIRGNGNNNFWKIKSQGGSPQANRFRRVGFFNLNNCITVSFGTNNYNADLFRFDSCRANDINGWVFGIDSNKNSQSVVHTFNDCDFESINGHIIHLKSGGTIEVRGGSWIMNQNGRAFHFDDITGAGIGPSNKMVNVYGTKFEYQYYSTTDEKIDYYPLFYNNSRMILNFVGCNFNQFLYKGTGEKSFYGYIGELGEVSFENSCIPYCFQIKVDPNLSTSTIGKSTVVFNKCELSDNLDKIVIQQNSNTYQGGNYAVVISEDTKSSECIDTQLNQLYGNRPFATKKKMKIFTQNSNPITSLPAKKASNEADKIMIVYLPIGAIITDVKLYFTTIGDGNTHTVSVKDSQDNVIVEGSHIGTSADAVFSTNNLFRIIKTENDRILKIVGTGVNANGGIGGFVAVEYY